MDQRQANASCVISKPLRARRPSLNAKTPRVKSSAEWRSHELLYLTNVRPHLTEVQVRHSREFRGYLILALAGRHKGDSTNSNNSNKIWETGMDWMVLVPKLKL